MLTAMRRGAKGFMSKLLLGFLVLSFGIWGIGDFLRHSSSGAVATVGSETISINEYEEAIRRLRQMLGEHLTPDILKSLNIFQITLDDLISRKLIAQETQRLGIRVDEKELIRTIANEQSFKNAQGKFDKTLFEQTLRESGLSEESYLNRLSNQLANNLLSDTLSGDFLFDELTPQYLYNVQNEQRKVTIVTVPPANLSEVATPSDGDLQAFYDSNKLRYMAPEYRALTYIRLVPEEIFKDISISRQELFDIYKERMNSLSTPEKRDISQLLYSSKAEAENAFGLLRGGTAFEEVAKTVPPLNKDALSLGVLTKEQLPAGGAEVYGLALGEYTLPIESPFGWHIFKVNTIQEKHTTPFEEVSATLEKELRQQKAEAMVSNLTEKVEDAIAGGGSLNDAAESTGLHAMTTDLVSREGRKSDNTQVLDAAKDETLLNAAFQLGENETSDLMNEPGGGYVVVHVDRLTPARQKTLEEVHGQVMADFRQEKAQGLAFDRAREKVKAINAGAKDSAAAHALVSGLGTHNVVLRRSGIVSGDKKVTARISSVMMQQIFTLSPSHRASNPVAGTDGAMFALLDNVAPAPAPDSSPESKRLYESLKSGLQQNVRAELMQQYLRALRDRYPVEINQDVMQRFTNQM
ncbi:MAG: SurA N-terminal domain-containing protein [Rickettsiales bacterium]